MAKPIAVTDETFEEEVVKSDTPVLVDFWAEWCGPCKAIMPIVDELADEYDGRVKFAKLDVDSSPNTPREYGIRGIPALLIFNEGSVAKRVVGAVPKETLRRNIDEAVAG